MFHMLAALHNPANLYFLILTAEDEKEITTGNESESIQRFLQHNLIGAEVAGNDETVSFLGRFLVYNSL